MAFSSAVTQEADGGNPGSAYKLAWQDNNNSSPCYMYKDFGIADRGGVKFSSDFKTNSVATKRRAGWGMMRNAAGAGIGIAVDSDPYFGNTITITHTTGWNEYGTNVARDTIPPLNDSAWYRMEISAYNAGDGRLTISATLKSGDVVLHTITATTTTEIGGFCGFFGMVYEQLSGASFALFDNIRVETITGQALVKTNVVNAPEVSGQDMLTGKWVGPFVATGPELECNMLSFDMTLPRGLSEDKSISWKIQVRKVNDFEQPIESWSVLASEVYSTSKATPIRLSYDYAVPSGRYMVRMQRTDVRDDSADVAHDLQWQGMRADLTIRGVSCDTATYVIGRIRASEQLSGLSQRRISVLSNRMIPVWNGTTWSPNQVTRSAAWAMADVLRNKVYGRKLDDDQVDLDTLLYLDGVWAARQDRFDMVFDNEVTTWDALSTILRGGRAVPLIRGSRYTAVRDSLQTLPVAMYSMRNIKKGSFSIAYLLPETDQITALDIEYWDHRRWDWVIVTAQVHDGVFYVYRGETNRPSTIPEPDERVKMRLTGVIGEYQAKREAVYHLADTYYRRRRATYRTELDGLLPAYGSLVLVNHDVPNWGQAGDVWDYDEETQTISTTEPVVFDDFGAHYVRLQKPDGSLSAAIPATPGSNDRELVLASDPGFEVVVDDGGKERPRYIFGPSTNQGAACKVKALRPQDNFEVEHIVIMEDDRVHLVDKSLLPGGDIQDAISDGTTSGDGSSGGGGTSADDFSADDFIVSLINHSVMGIGFGAGDVSAGFTIASDGSAQGIENGVAVDFGTEWIASQPVTSTATSLFEVMVTLSSGTTPSGTLGTWLNCGTDRSWGLSASSGGSYYFDTCSLLVQIRDVATSTVQSIATINLKIQSYEVTGGG